MFTFVDRRVTCGYGGLLSRTAYDAAGWRPVITSLAEVTLIGDAAYGLSGAACSPGALVGHIGVCLSGKGIK
jgi:hypothetical protein